MHVPAVDACHYLEKRTFTALGEPQNAYFHNKTPLIINKGAFHISEWHILQGKK
jgi:hypothetical protein